MTVSGSPRLIVHGGAGDWVGFDEASVLAAVRKAAAVGWEILKGGGSALDAVEKATNIMEDDPQFDSGYGSFINAAGEVEMDALIADGSTLKYGAVAAVRRVQYPISLARLVMTRTNNLFFAGDGADQLAAQLGVPLVANVQMITPKELEAFVARQKEAQAKSRAALGTGTCGAVALDAAGHLASATSTGGTPDKPKGRIGDTPIFGAGGYAEDALGAASATGVGENIMRYFLCKRVVDQITGGTNAQSAAQTGLDFLSDRIPNPQAGIIVIGADGSVGAQHTTTHMPIAWVTADGDIQTTMKYEKALL
ncbi:MAG: isoaspartyl peptidase/L-asparaginase [Chloroflexi bacterium]|nr:isoaspartyl peptidase/L-asparaginase [Chloroflexota bacterium]MCC6893120.1 isoaspartyl peptidase/L-asparaginase [Anaerolineae bacterium]